jgi:mycothiol system anti-sigma-R factor
MPDSHSSDPDSPDHTCDEALTELYRFLDDELDEVTRLHIEVHLDGCSACLEAFDFEAELRKVIRSRCQERVPDELRDRVLRAIAEATLDDAGVGDLPSSGL